MRRRPLVNLRLVSLWSSANAATSLNNVCFNDRKTTTLATRSNTGVKLAMPRFVAWPGFLDPFVRL